MIELLARPAFETVRREVQVTGDFLREVVDRVRHGRMESRVEFAACSEPAGAIGRFEHEHALPALREVRRADQTVVSRTNDNGVVLIQAEDPFLVLISQIIR